MKTQAVRLVDVFALGPFMIYAATREKLSKEEKIALLLSGVATILYNARNYILARGKNEPVPNA